MFHAIAELGVAGQASRYPIGIAWTKKLVSGLAPRRARPFFVESLESRSLLSTITVSNIGDTGPGTLRAAIEQANLDPAQDTITFAPSVTGTITLSTALPDLSANVVIAGPGLSVLSVARSGQPGTPAFRIFTVAAGVEATVSGLTISNGQSDSGGGISNAGTLTVIDSALDNNSASNAGGIYNAGTLTVSGSTLDDNGARSSEGNGGGIYNGGTMTLTGSALIGNLITGAGSGGGIYNDGTLTVTDSSVGSNGGGSGGGIANDRTLTLTNSTLNFNNAAAGGGIYNGNAGTLTVTGCTLDGNGVSGGTFFQYAGFGGGIDNMGTLTVIDSTLSDNSASTSALEYGGSGGGIYNGGTMTLTGSAVNGNTAANDYGGSSFGVLGVGGGIDNLGELMVTDCAFNRNTTGGAGGNGGSGGGIYNGGELTITGSALNGNFANDSFGNAVGGGIDNTTTGTLTVIGSTFSDNSAIGSGNGASVGYGGGIYNDGTVNVTASVLSGNAVTFEFSSGGGGIYNGGTLTVTGSTLNDNSAANFFVSSLGNLGAGGIDNTGTLRITSSTLLSNSSTYGGNGGGILNSGTLMLTDCTLSRNAAIGNGGGISNSGTLSLTDCTLSGNAAGLGGGGVSNSGTLNLTDCTLSGNAAAVGGGVYVVQIPSGGVPVSNLTAIASIFANSSNGNLVLGPGTTFVSLGHNLFSDTPAVLLNPTDLINTDPLLGLLADNGGPTLTQALLPGSPAIDAGVAVPGVTTDQRGIARPQGVAPDIGAFESRGFILAIASGDNQSAPAGSAFPAPLVVAVTSPFGEPVAGGRVTFTAPATGASAAFAASTVVIDANGRASVTASATALSGSYAVAAGAVGANSVAFGLTNMVAPPTVVGIQRHGVHLQPTSILVTFNQPMDSDQAEALTNYRLVSAGPDRRFGTRDDRIIRISSVQYDAASQMVTIRPAHRLPLRRRYRLTILGTAPGGLMDTAGLFLDGAGTGQQGSNYVKVITDKLLVPPFIHKAGKQAAVHHGDRNRLRFER